MKPQPWLSPLAPLYAAGVGLKNLGYDKGWLRSRHLRYPVISVGNLSTGGSGKTPLVIALAAMLQQASFPVDVLSRGYGRTNDATVRVDPSGSADEYGDEPLLIARAADVPVYVGRSRFAAGALAERNTLATPHIHLVDDGFQHRHLARDLDIVVMHTSDLTAQLLPAGHLREPLSSLARAHVMVVREEDDSTFLAQRNLLRSEALIWRIRRSLSLDAAIGPTLAFCGIARPEEFFAGLRSSGIELAATLSFSDHHRYTPTDLLRLIETARASHAQQFITTEKDAVRLSAAALQQIRQALPLSVARLQVTFLDPEAVRSSLIGFLKRRLDLPSDRASRETV